MKKPRKNQRQARRRKPLARELKQAQLAPRSLGLAPLGVAALASVEGLSDAEAAAQLGWTEQNLRIMRVIAAGPVGEPETPIA